MKASWIIENFTDSEDYRDLINAVKESGRDCYAIDKRNHFDFDPKWCEGRKTIFQGSIQMARLVKEKVPDCNVFCTENNYLCTNYYPEFHPFLFNEKHAATTVKNFKENRWLYYFQFGKEALIFIRPDRGDKLFTGQLLDLQDFDRFFTNNLAFNGADDDIIYVSTPKTVIGEWRFVVSKDEKIIAQSTYVYQNQKTWIPSAPEKATALVNKLLKVGYHPDTIYCMDICEGSDNEYYLLELTSFSSAGLYACNKHDVVREVSKVVEG